MSAPQEPAIVAEHGGLVVAERGADILVIDRGTGPSQISAFVLLVIALVCCGFGAVAVASAAVTSTPQVPGPAGAAVLALGIAAVVAMALTVKAIRRRRMRALLSFAPVAVLDRAHRTFRTAGVVAPLDQVRFERRLQMTSSSPKLVAVTPSGTYVLKRGHPFGGGIGTLDRVLTDVAHGPRR